MPAPALMMMAMPAMAAKAANRLPLTPQRRREKPRPAKLPMPDRNAMLSASRDQSPAAVLRYPVNKIGKIRGFLANFADSKAGAEPAFSLISTRRRSVPRHPRARPVEAVVDGRLHDMFVVAEAAERQESDRGNEPAAAEIIILIFDPGRPVPGEHVFQAGACGVAVAMAAIEGERDRKIAERQGLAVVGVGVASLDVKQRRTKGEADAARHRGEGAPGVGVDESAGEEDAVVAAAEPVVLAFDADEEVGGELVIGAGLPAAEQSALMAVADRKTADDFVTADGAADVAADVEAGPGVDRAGVGRSLGVGLGAEIGGDCRDGCAESGQNRDNGQEFHWFGLQRTPRARPRSWTAFE